MRFALAFMPYLYLISSFGLVKILKNINKKIKFIFVIAIIVLLLFQYGFQINKLFTYQKSKENKFFEFQNYLDKDEVKGQIWISNPIFIINSDKKADNLMYYPTFNHDKFLELKSKINEADNVLINTCDLYCEPYNNLCESDKEELINLLKNSLKVVFEKEGECNSYIFKK